MNNEKNRLDKMLNEHKISQEDYSVLSKALHRKAFYSKMQSKFWLNPFQKIAGFKALVIGMMILLMISYLGVVAKVYFLGPISIINAAALAKQTNAIGFLFLTYQNIVSWLTLSILFIVTAKVLQKQRLRIVDFLGTVVFAQYPTLFNVLFIGISRFIYPSLWEVDMSKGMPIHASIGQYVNGAVVSVFMVWQIITYFYAFKESSGLLEKKLWIGFLVSIIAAGFIASPLTTMFMN